MYWCPVDLILNKPPQEIINCVWSGDLAGHVTYLAAVCCALLPDGITYQQDGALPHFVNIVR